MPHKTKLVKPLTSQGRTWCVEFVMLSFSSLLSFRNDIYMLGYLLSAVVALALHGYQMVMALSLLVMLMGTCMCMKKWVLNWVEIDHYQYNIWLSIQHLVSHVVIVLLSFFRGRMELLILHFLPSEIKVSLPSHMHDPVRLVHWIAFPFFFSSCN